MDARDIFLLATTAFVGLFCGVYVYLTVFAPVYVDDQPDNFSSERFEIIGEAYGGCTFSGCPSFRVTVNRSFTYLPDGTGAVIEGTYPRREFAALRRRVEQANLETLAAPVASGQDIGCISFVDGIDYRYTVTIDGKAFELDTCYSQLKNSAELQSALQEAFEVVADPESFAYSTEDFQQAGVIGYFFPNLFE